MRVAAALVLAAAIALGSSAASAGLSGATKAFLEGQWSNNCTGAPSDRDYAVTYEFEFLRSGGSIFFDDGVDVQVRGTIVSSRESGADTTWPTDLRAAPNC
jgi:hypothetical protein